MVKLIKGSRNRHIIGNLCLAPALLTVNIGKPLYGAVLFVDLDIVVQIGTVIRIFLHNFISIVITGHQFVKEVGHLFLVLSLKGISPEIDAFVIVFRCDHPVKPLFVFVKADLEMIVIVSVIDIAQCLVQTAEFISRRLDMLFHPGQKVAAENLLTVLFRGF